MHILSLKPKADENQKVEHFIAFIFSETGWLVLLLMDIQQIINNFISKSKQFRHSTITFH